MTIDFRPPRSCEEARLRVLFTEAFESESFTDLFFRTGFSPDRCLVAADGEILAALHWFDCRLDGKKAAYIYGIAAFRACRGRGIGSKLIRAALAHLKQCGYGPVLLVPAEGSLFGYYERFGFRSVSTIQEQIVFAGVPIPIRQLSVEAYTKMRLEMLPAHSLLQDDSCFQLLAGYAAFYATAHGVAAISEDMVWEFLGDVSEVPGLIAALGLAEATVRTPGRIRPFAMGIGTEGPVYLGLALD